MTVVLEALFVALFCTGLLFAWIVLFKRCAQKAPGQRQSGRSKPCFAETPDKELVFFHASNNYLDAEHKNIDFSMIVFRYKGDRFYFRAYENTQAEGLSATPEQARTIVGQSHGL